MEQMTVGMLVKLLTEACLKDPKVAYKKIVVSDDNEGNGYHGMFYAPTVNAKQVAEAIKVSNGIYDSDTENPKEIVILG